MRTERDQLPVEISERARPAVDVVQPSPTPSRNGHAPHRNGTNGNGAHGNGVHAPHSNGTNGASRGRISTVVVACDWDSFLPERSTSLGWKIGQRVKRLLDVLGAGLGLVVLSPALLTVALLIKLTSRGPVFYVCEYVGLRGRRFPGYKFRTMVADAEAQKARLAHLNHMQGPAFKIREDPRITPLGRFLRKYSIDELPQLWNVVRGDMSLVGPRPPLPEEWAEYKEWQRGKLAVVPGITCYWQINGRSEITDFDQWAKLDLKYIQEWSVGTDLKILARTVPAVLSGDGAY